ncbi:MAG: ATP-binding protein [Cyclobacteriaceae bacterium]
MAALNREMNWFSDLLECRFSNYFNSDSTVALPVPMDASTGDSSYERLVTENEMDSNHRILLMLAVIPHIRPQLLDIFFTKNSNFDKPFTEFGGLQQQGTGGFIPTVETACFLISAGDLSDRFQVLKLLSAGSPLISEDIIRIGEIEEQSANSFFSRSISLNEIYRDYFITGRKADPESLNVFPAAKIETQMEWSDLVLEEAVKTEIDQICQWINNAGKLKDLVAVRKYVKPGFRCLFYGPPGTGKTLTASLIGKETDRDVYRIDLSMIVSKYIGETEKNLSRVFDYAEKRNWILFFDEADALFGKRTQTNSANDRFANQEVAYLLQRIEDFPGIVILASNLKSNLDEAFARRFQAMIYFPMPDIAQRLTLWENMFSSEVALEEACDLSYIAENYELSGGSAINVFRYGLLKAMSRDSLQVKYIDLIDGIRKEYLKYGRTL